MSNRSKTLIRFSPFIFILLAFIFGASGQYFSADDLGMLLNATQNPQAVDQLLVPVGRWLNAILIKGVFPIIPNTDALVWIRLITAFLLTVFAVLLALFVSRLQPEAPSLPVFVAGLAVLTPATMTMLAWAQHVTVVFGAVCVLGAFALLLVSERQSAAVRVGLIGLGSFALFLSASVNQQLLALSGVLFFLIVYFSQSLREIVQRSLAAGVMTAGGYVIAFLAIRLFVDTPGSRASLVSDIPAKITWFFNEPLPNAALGYVFPRLLGAEGRSFGWMFACLAVLVVFALIVLLRRGERRTNLAVAGLFLAAIPVAYGPVLLVAESWGSFRSIWPLQMLFSSVIALLVWEAVSRFLRGATLHAVLSAIVLCVLAGWIVQFQIHVRGPYMTEASNARSEIVQYLSSNPIEQGGAIRVVYPIWFEANAKYVYYDDIGGPVVRPWTVEPLVILTAQENGFGVDAAQIQRIEFDDRATALADDPPFIDLTNFAGRSRLPQR